MALKKGVKSKGIAIDMTGVESGGLVAEGDYEVKVLKAEHKIAESSGKPTIAWEFEITSGPGGKLFYNTSLQPQALFNLKNLLICLGMEVPNSKINLDLDEVVDLECGVTVGHEVYDGKKRARITDIWPLEDFGEEGDEDEEEDEDTEEDEEMDYSALDLADLKILCKDREIKVLKKDDKTSLIKKLKEADEAEEDEEL